MFLTVLVIIALLAIWLNNSNAVQVGGGETKTAQPLAKIIIRVGKPYDTPHHIGLVVDHYHPLFEIKTIDGPPSKNEFAIMLEQNAIGYEIVTRLHSAELLLIAGCQSFVDSIRDLRDTGFNINVGPKGGLLEGLAKMILEREAVRPGRDVYLTHYNDEELKELFGAGIDLFFVLDSTPNRLLVDIAREREIKILDLARRYQKDNGTALGEGGLTPELIHTERHRRYYNRVCNFKSHHVWVYTMPYVVVAGKETDPEVIDVVEEVFRDLVPVLRTMPYWE